VGRGATPCQSDRRCSVGNHPADGAPGVTNRGRDSPGLTPALQRWRYGLGLRDDGRFPIAIPNARGGSLFNRRRWATFRPALTNTAPGDQITGSIDGRGRPSAPAEASRRRSSLPRTGTEGPSRGWRPEAYLGSMVQRFEARAVPTRRILGTPRPLGGAQRTRAGRESPVRRFRQDPCRAAAALDGDVVPSQSASSSDRRPRPRAQA
jgi:hypothetical protein